MEHILFEHIGGYELFELKAFEDLSAYSYNEYMGLTQVVNHVSTLPFTDVQEVTAASKSDVLDSKLAGFLSMSNVTILHADKSLKNALEKAGIAFKESPNIMRGIRTNIHKIKKSEMDKKLLMSAACVFSREAIKFNMEREDNVIPVIEHEITQTEEEIAMLMLKIEQSVNWVLPNFSEMVKGEDYNEKLAAILGKSSVVAENRQKDLNQLLIEGLVKDMLEEIDSATKESLKTLNNIILSKKKALEELNAFLETKMRKIAPNLRQILGDRMTARLIDKANGLVNLTMSPSSTVQLLGAEKSLFRSLKMKKPTPKFGILFDLDFVKRDKGMICRYIAAKCSLAARIDCFDADRGDQYGKELRRAIDRRIKTRKRGVDDEATETMLERVHKKIERLRMKRESKTTEAAGEKQQRINSN
ncbi:nucleolar protein 56 [Enteropsectra breve]|nr:nucleolar protein 56 [Enteropsectra breve]